MMTPEKNIKEIIQYLKNEKLPESEITYLPELTSLIVETITYIQLQHRLRLDNENYNYKNKIDNCENILTDMIKEIKNG